MSWWDWRQRARLRFCLPVCFHTSLTSATQLMIVSQVNQHRVIQMGKSQTKHPVSCIGVFYFSALNLARRDKSIVSTRVQPKYHMFHLWMLFLLPFSARAVGVFQNIHITFHKQTVSAKNIPNDVFCASRECRKTLQHSDKAPRYRLNTSIGDNLYGNFLIIEFCEIIITYRPADQRPVLVRTAGGKARHIACQ